VTNSDEANMIACLLAKAMFKVKRKIARIRNPEYFGNQALLENLGIDPAINPELEVAKAVVRLLETPFASEVEEFEEGLVKVIGFKVPEDFTFARQPLKSLREVMPPKKFLIGIMEKGDRVLIPSGRDVIEPGDIIYVPVKKWEIGDVMSFLEVSAKPAKKVMLVGGGRIGYYIASFMERKGADVKIIEKDEARCRFLSSSLRKAVVLHGDGSDGKLLQEENISRMNAFVSVSNNDELNIMASLLAKRMGAQKTITLVNRTDYLSLAHSLGLQSVLSPRLITASSILRYVRRGEILSLTAIADNKAEIIEARVAKGSALEGKSLSEAGLPRNCLVGVIIRGERISIPGGEDVVRAGDKVIIFTLSESIKAVEKLLA
jgi:trk system potassium uptake protein TrkA